MALLVGIALTMIYLALAWLGIISAIHGPELMGQFVLAYLVVALLALWGLYFFLRRRNLRRKALIFAAGGVGIGLCLVGTSDVTRDQLLDRELARFHKQEAATEVSNMRDEPLLSPKGNPIGIRLRYSMRFPDSNYFWQGVRLDPETDLDVGIWANGRLVGQTIDPPMQVAAVSNNPPPPNTSDPNFGVARRYEAGTLYNFTVDMLPYFLMPSEDKKRLCVVLPSAEYTAGFKKLLATDNDVRFRVSVNGTKYLGVTSNTYNLKKFYRSAITEGAPELPGAGFGGAIAPCK